MTDHTNRKCIISGFHGDFIGTVTKVDDKLYNVTSDENEISFRVNTPTINSKFEQEDKPTIYYS